MTNEEIASKLLDNMKKNSIPTNAISSGNKVFILSRKFNIDICNKEQQNSMYDYYKVESPKQVEDILLIMYPEIENIDNKTKIKEAIRSNANLNDELFLAAFWL